MRFPIFDCKCFVRWTAAFLMMGFVAVASGQVQAGSAAKIGSHPADLTFRDFQGVFHTLKTAQAQSSAFVFLSTQCPVANGYTPRLLALEKAYRTKGVRFFGVYSNAVETRADIVRHAAERGYRFPLVQDNGVLRARLGATVIPQVVLLDGSGTLRYRGRIDDQRDPARVTQKDFQNALDAVLHGKTVARAETPAFGCAIVATLPKTTKMAAVTYTRDIAPILQANCVTCHRAGEVAPIKLENYRQVVSVAGLVRSYTQSRRMPPWGADTHGEFHDERRLSQKQLDTIAKWVDSGMPQGDPKDLPVAPKFAKSGWKMGTPDRLIEMPETYDVPAEGRDVYRCFVIPSGISEDKWIAGAEVIPGNRAVVHHVIAYLDYSGTARKLDAADPGPGYTNPTPGNPPGFLPVGIIGAWVPGNEPNFFPSGVGNFWPKNTDIVLEVHYHMNGKAEKDKTKFGIHFVKGPVEKRALGLFVADRSLRIPAGASNYTARTEQFILYTPLSGAFPTAARELPEAITVYSVGPHMHLLGKAMKITATLPDGTKRVLLDATQYEFNWQLTYRFREPVKLPKGTKIEVVARYDNSAKNPNNPRRVPREVTWGEQSTDEMLVAGLLYTRDAENLTKKTVAQTKP